MRGNPFGPCALVSRVLLIGCLIFAATSCENTTVNLDQDHDGWADGPLNQIRTLTLTRIQVTTNQDAIGHDELYVLVDGKRFPKGNTDQGIVPCHNLCGNWNTKAGSSASLTGAPGAGCSGTESDLSCNITVAERTFGLGPHVEPIVKVQVVEDDDDLFPIGGVNRIANDWSRADDDLLGSFDIKMTGVPSDRNQLNFIEHATMSGADYTLTFVERDTTFSDPNPQKDADTDGDGLLESTEHTLSHTFGGIADPRARDIFLEADTVAPATIDGTTPDILTTQFFYNGIALHIDHDGFLAGYPGGSENIGGSEARAKVFFSTGSPNVPTISDYMNGSPHFSINRHFAAARKKVFHYLLVVSDLQEGTDEWFGKSDEPGDKLAVQGSLLVFDRGFDYQVITVMHELGHNLDLCHPRDVGKAGCMRYTLGAVGPPIDGATAMGTPQDGDKIFNVINSITRPVDYLPPEWAAVDLKSGGAIGP